MPTKLTYDGVCPLLPLRVMGRHKDERLEKAITMALNSGGAMPFKAAWAKCGKPGTWKSAPPRAQQHVGRERLQQQQQSRAGV